MDIAIALILYLVILSLEGVGPPQSLGRSDRPEHSPIVPFRSSEFENHNQLLTPFLFLLCFLLLTIYPTSLLWATLQPIFRSLFYLFIYFYGLHMGPMYAKTLPQLISCSCVSCLPQGVCPRLLNMALGSSGSFHIPRHSYSIPSSLIH